jgi:hypothetical protein
MIDEPGRVPPRFPASAAATVKERLREKLTALNQEAGGIQVLASAAPGTDIICHELCHEMGVKNTMCLPTSRVARPLAIPEVSRKALLSNRPAVGSQELP